MTDTLYALVSDYGLWIVAISAFLSCLAVPIPTSVIMMTAGAFAAAGDFVLWQVWLAAWAAAVLGDQAGFQIGRMAGPTLVDWLSDHTRHQRQLARARSAVREHGGTGVFFSTWLFAPLGPWVNLIAGTARLNRWRFTAWDAAGEAIWVTAYVGLGYLYGARLEDLTRVVADWSGLVLSLTAAIVLAVLLTLRLIRRHRRQGRAA